MFIDIYAFYILSKSGYHVIKIHLIYSIDILLVDRDRYDNPFLDLTHTAQISFQLLVHREFRL